MVVLEGPDGSGKTSLAQKLAFDLGMEIKPKVVQSDGSYSIDLKEWVDQDLQEWARARGKSRFIYDRHRLVSELIYGPLVRGSLAPGFENLGWLTSALRGFHLRRPSIVVALPPWETVRKNLENTDQPGWVLSRGARIYWTYHAWAAMTEAWVWDYTTEDANERYQSLLELITWEGKRSWGQA